MVSGNPVPHTKPPAALKVKTWAGAYDVFYHAMGDGRERTQFRNSMKNARDSFDILFDNGRIGWIDRHRQRPSLSARFQRVHGDWSRREDGELELFVLNLIGTSIEHDALEPFEGELRTEGGKKVYVSTVPERDATLRRHALQLHGYDCMACGFNFERFYGYIGKHFIEVHHVIPLTKGGKRKTNPSTDLIVLCANCHRMVHRRKGICLSLEEIRNHIQ